MVHPISTLQSVLLNVWQANGDLTAALAGGGIFDAPTKGALPPYITVAEHTILSRDADDAPGHEHRMVVHCWVNAPSRLSALALAEPLVASVLEAELSWAGLAVTLARHLRTQTSIDRKSGLARAAVHLRFLTEPSA